MWGGSISQGPEFQGCVNRMESSRQRLPRLSAAILGDIGLEGGSLRCLRGFGESMRQGLHNVGEGGCDAGDQSSLKARESKHGLVGSIYCISSKLWRQADPDERFGAWSREV